MLMSRRPGSRHIGFVKLFFQGTILTGRAQERLDGVKIAGRESRPDQVEASQGLGVRRRGGRFVDATAIFLIGGQFRHAGHVGVAVEAAVVIADTQVGRRLALGFLISLGQAGFAFRYDLAQFLSNNGRQFRI